MNSRYIRVLPAELSDGTPNPSESFGNSSKTPTLPNGTAYGVGNSDSRQFPQIPANTVEVGAQFLAQQSEPLKVLIACEFSGIVRDAFLRHGHDVLSCDLLPSELPGPHHQGDVLAILDRGWDLMIAHPPCTYLTNAGVRHLHSIPTRKGPIKKIHGAERWKAMREAAAFFRRLLESSIPRICVENPIPHRYAVKEIGRKYNQLIQPWQFGQGETKATCLWLKNLPSLKATGVVSGRFARIHLMSPGKDRSKNRSRTYTGIAEAMAAQWGNLETQQSSEAA